MSTKRGGLPLAVTSGWLKVQLGVGGGCLLCYLQPWEPSSVPPGLAPAFSVVSPLVVAPAG